MSLFCSLFNASKSVIGINLELFSARTIVVDRLFCALETLSTMFF